MSIGIWICIGILTVLVIVDQIIIFVMYRRAIQKEEDLTFMLYTEEKGKGTDIFLFTSTSTQRAQRYNDIALYDCIGQKHQDQQYDDFY